MQSLGEHLQSLRGRIGLLCIGNPDGGDDALGVRLGEQLAGDAMPDIFIAGTEPERLLFGGTMTGYDHLLFVDAVDFGAPPGSATLLGAAEITSRFPQVSTHRLSLGLLAQWVQAGGKTAVWLLGVQPFSLRPGQDLSPAVQQTLARLRELLVSRLSAGANAC